MGGRGTQLWKAGKRAAERDSITGRKLYLTMAPPQLQGKPDGYGGCCPRWPAAISGLPVAWVGPSGLRRAASDIDNTKRFTAFYKSFARDSTELVDAYEAFQLSVDRTYPRPAGAVSGAGTAR